MNLRGFFIRLVGNKKREELDLKKIKRVLIIGGRIGDIIVKTPIIRELYKLNANMKIDVSVCKSGKSLLEKSPYINKIIVGDDKREGKIKRAFNSIKWGLKNRGKYDLFLDLGNSPRFIHILSLKLMKPRYLIGCYRMEKFGIKKDELTIFDKYVSTYSKEHICDRGLRFLEVLGIEIKNRQYDLFLGEYGTKYKNFFDKNKFNIILNYKGSIERRTIQWEDIKYFIEKIPKIDKNIKIYIIGLGEDRKKLQRILEGPNERVELLPETKEVIEVGGFIKYCDMVVSVDTGIVHIAGALNKPLVGIYPKEENNFYYFGPRMDKYRVIRGQEKGSTIEGYDKEEVLKKIMDLKQEIERIKE